MNTSNTPTTIYVTDMQILNAYNVYLGTALGMDTNGMNDSNININDFERFKAQYLNISRLTLKNPIIPINPNPRVVLTRRHE